MGEGRGFLPKPPPPPPPPLHQQQQQRRQPWQGGCSAGLGAALAYLSGETGADAREQIGLCGPSKVGPSAATRTLQAWAWAVLLGVLCAGVRVWGSGKEGRWGVRGSCSGSPYQTKLSILVISTNLTFQNFCLISLINIIDNYCPKSKFVLILLISIKMIKLQLVCALTNSFQISPLFSPGFHEHYLMVFSCQSN